MEIGLIFSCYLLGIALFTLIEFLIVVAVVAVLVIIGVSAARSLKVTTTGSWVNPPTTIPYDGTKNLSYKVTQTRFGGSPKPVSGRVINFSVSPANDFTITPTGTTNLGTGDITSITVTHLGGDTSACQIVATDAKSGKTTPVLTLTVN